MTDRFHLRNMLTTQSFLCLNVGSPCQAILRGSACWLCPKQFLVFLRQLWTRSRRYSDWVRIQGSRCKPGRLLMGDSDAALC